MLLCDPRNGFWLAGVCARRPARPLCTLHAHVDTHAPHRLLRIRRLLLFLDRLKGAVLLRVFVRPKNLT